MQSIVSVDPFRCRVWHLHDRLEDQITIESCADEIATFEEHGQLVPVLGRRLLDDPNYEIELVCGARRLFVARHLKKDLLVDVRELTDREAIIAMDMENRQRKDLSPYERGRGYAAWLRGGHFESQEDIASALKVSPSVVSRLLKLARLPSVVVGAFGSPDNICEGWGVKLAELLEDPVRKPPAIRAARAIGSRSSPLPPLPPREIYRQLLAAGARTEPGGRKAHPIRHDRVVEGDDGAPLFRIRHQQDSIALLLPLDRTSAKTLDAIQRAVARILNDSATDISVSNFHEFGDLQRARA